MGFPTANLDPHNEVMPPDGVYAVRVLLGNERLGGVANIGVRPTFTSPDVKRQLEVYVFDFDREVYSEDLEVCFLKKLRDEKRFDSPDALKAQIAADLKAARAILRATADAV